MAKVDDGSVEPFFVYAVPKEDLALPLFRDKLDKAILNLVNFDPVEFCIYDLRNSVYDGEYTVLAGFVGSRLVGLAFARMVEYPTKKTGMEVINVLGFCPMETGWVRKFADLVENVARENRCDRLTWTGRKGWHKHFDGWCNRESRSTMIKDLTPIETPVEDDE